ncbi:MAG: UvrD-helicase domain-containing protein [Clostridia bacterium]|nr:UvrD-helicase domain-containing protein [Clostridia bacterium]
MKWTNEQLRAIKSRGSDILLSAAAGSGKTTVMVERVFEIVKDGCDIESLLIITFTRAAAADMKQKLVRRFIRALDDSAEAESGQLPLNAAQRVRIADALDGVERANICTIDSYCSFVLRQHFEAVGVDPGYRILDDAEERRMQSQAIDAALEKAMEDPDDGFVALCFGREINQVKQIIKEMYAFSRARPDPEGFLDMALEAMPESDGEIWFSTLYEAARGCLMEAEALMDEASGICSRNDGPYVYASCVEMDASAIKHMLSMSYDELRPTIESFALSKLTALRKNKNDPDDETRIALGNRVKEIRKNVKSCMDRAIKLMPDKGAALEDMRSNIPAMRAIKKLCLDYAGELWALKSENMALSFNDVAQLALKALGDPDIADYQKSKFEYVFVDEYQDVSDLQEAIISRVVRPGRLFMVGDVKQSIYSFRQAEPSLFIGKYADYSNGKGELIQLSSNFRSRGAVIDFVNAVFSLVMNSPMSEMPYEGDALLVRAAEFAGQDPPVELHLFDKSTADGDYGEAEMVAETVKELIGQSMYPGSERKIAAGDIAVIARTRETLKLCDQALRRAGVKSYVDVAEGYLEALEVRIMLCVMRAIENRRRDFPLIETLRSPVVGITSTQLAEIRAAFPDGPFCEAFNRYMELDGELAERLRRVKADFDRWRFLSRCLPLSQWIDLVMNQTGFYAYVGALPGGKARQGNLDLLCNYASDYSANHAGGLTGFLDYITEVESLGGDMASAHTSSDIGDCVILMTAHKAKGLEFPVVVAAGLGKNISTGRAYCELRAHRQLGAGLYYNDAQLGARRDTLSRLAIEAKSTASGLEEEKRVAYVMLTRAVERLVMTGMVQNRENWEMRRSCPRLAAIRPASFLDMVSCCVPDDRVYFHMPAQEGGGEAVEESESDDFAEQVEKARQVLLWQYPYEGEAWQPVKLTVTGLAREITGAMEAAPIARRPKFISDVKTGAGYGTAIHAALSFIDLDSLKGLSPMELDRKTGENLARLKEKGIVDASANKRVLTRFFQSDTGKRLLNSDEVRREWQFNLKMTVAEALGGDSENEIIVQGMIDCCFKENGEWVLIDYKTDSFAGEPSEEYINQVKLYKLALERITSTRVSRAILCFLTAGVEYEV